jgi:hypothetical protein
MSRIPTLAVAAALALSALSGRGDEQKAQAGKNEQGIKAAVSGALHFESGSGYFVAVRPADTKGQEMRVWLWISEDKALVRKLQGLDGKDVIVKGELAQQPTERQSSVPPLGMYMSRFEIEAAGAG